MDKKGTGEQLSIGFSNLVLAGTLILPTLESELLRN